MENKIDLVNSLIEAKILDIAIMCPNLLQNCDTIIVAKVFLFLLEINYKFTKHDFRINSERAHIILDYLEKHPEVFDGNNIPVLTQWADLVCIKRYIKIYPNYPHNKEGFIWYTQFAQKREFYPLFMELGINPKWWEYDQYVENHKSKVDILLQEKYDALVAEHAALVAKYETLHKKVLALLD